MGTNSSAMEQAGNPVLKDYLGFPVQPYWFIILQLLAIQILQRLYSRFTCFRRSKNRSWYLPLEVLILGNAAGVKPSTYSLVDFILSLVSLAHFIYACYKQTECSRSARYSTWNCYNAFGYRLYNYVLPSVISVLVQSFVQLASTIKRKDISDGEDDGEEETCASCRRYLKYFLLGATILINLVVCLVFVPYFITNALPMVVGFIWVLIPLLIALILVYAGFISILLCVCICKNQDNRTYPTKNNWNPDIEDKRSKGGKCCRVFGVHCLIGLQVFGCLILSMAYNYSQYCYFGGGYLRVLGYEFQSRDTVAYFNTLGNDTTLVTHNILAFF